MALIHDMLLLVEQLNLPQLPFERADLLFGLEDDGGAVCRREVLPLRSERTLVDGEERSVGVVCRPASKRERGSRKELFVSLSSCKRRGSGRARGSVQLATKRFTASAAPAGWAWSMAARSCSWSDATWRVSGVAAYGGRCAGVCAGNGGASKVSRNRTRSSSAVAGDSGRGTARTFGGVPASISSPGMLQHVWWTG